MVAAPGINQLCHAFSALSNVDNVVSLRVLSSSEEQGTMVLLDNVARVVTFDAFQPDKGTQDLVESIFHKVQDASVKTKLLGYGLLWLLADVHGLYDIHVQLVHPDATMFGFSGKEQVLAFKRNLLSSTKLNYHVNAIHEIDVENMAVVADSDCLIEGKEGRGTDVAKLDPDTFLVKQVQAIRHGTTPDWNQRNMGVFRVNEE